MTRDEMRDRTKRLALRVIRLVAELPRNREGDIIGRQVLKSGTSIGANYREALHASSRKQFLAMVEIALREADETLYWIELIGESGILPPSRLAALQEECSQMVAILAATVQSVRRSRNDTDS
jgi:four helix bundle protein